MIDLKYYDEIVNFLYEESDQISKYLIDCYQNYLFNIKNTKSKESIDNIMNLYVQKGEFYKFVQKYFDLKSSSEIYSSYDKVIRKLNKLYKEYEIESMKKVNNTRWL